MMIRFFVYTVNQEAGEILLDYYDSYTETRQLLCDRVMLYSVIMEVKTIEIATLRVLECFSYINLKLRGKALPVDSVTLADTLPLVQKHIEFKTAICDYNGIVFQPLFDFKKP